MEKGVFLQHTFLPPDWAHIGRVTSWEVQGERRYIAWEGHSPGVESWHHFPWPFQPCSCLWGQTLVGSPSCHFPFVSLSAAGNRSHHCGKGQHPNNLGVPLLSGSPWHLATLYLDIIYWHFFPVEFCLLVNWGFWWFFFSLLSTGICSLLVEEDCLELRGSNSFQRFQFFKLS